MREFTRLLCLQLAFAIAACANTPRLPTADMSPPTAPEIIRSLELRNRYGLVIETSGAAIFVDSVTVHHVRGEASTVVWKDTAGVWRRSQVIENGPGGLLDVERSLASNETRLLSAAETGELERLIAQRSLYSGRVWRTREADVAGAYHVMEIITPYGRTVVRWDGQLLGKSGEVADIVLGRG